MIKTKYKKVYTVENYVMLIGEMTFSIWRNI